MNYKTTIFLLVVLIVVGVFYYWASDQVGPTDEDADTTTTEKTGTALFTADAFPTSSIKTITIESDGQMIELANLGADWEQTKPVRFALNTWSSKGLGDDAAALRYVERFKPGGKDAATLEEVGLAPAKAVVTFHFDNDTPAQTVKLGSRLTIGGRGHVTINDDPRVFIVNDALHKKILDDDPNDLRKKSIEGPKEGEADRVILTRNGATIDMVKSDGQWSFAPPLSGRADASAVKTLITDIGSIYLTDFVADRPQSLSLYGLDDPATTVTISVPPPPPPVKPGPGGEGEGEGEGQTPDEEGDGEDGQGEKDQPEAKPTVMTLRIGAPQDFEKEAYFATWSDADDPNAVVFTIAKRYVEKFDKSVKDVRDARLTPIVRGDVRELVLARADQPDFTLVYRQGAWAFADPGAGAPGGLGYEADQSQCGKLVDAIVNAKADEYVDDAQPTADPTATIILSSIGRPEPDVIKVHRGDDDKKYLVQRNNETTGYVVSAKDLELAFDPVIAFRDRTVIELARDKANRVMIVRADGTTYTFEREFTAVPVVTEPADDEQPEEQVADGENADEENADQDDSSPEPDTEEATPEVRMQPRDWKLAGHERFESQALDDLLDNLFPIKADGWQEAEPSGADVLTVNVFTTEGDDASLTIDTKTRLSAVTGKQAGAAFAITGFTVSADALKKFDAELRYRTVLDIQADDIAKVTVDQAGSKITISKNDDGNYVGSEDEKINESATGDLFDTLAGLRAERFTNETELAADNEAATITVEIKSGEQYALTVDAKGGRALLAATEGHPVFELDDETISKLTAELIEKEEADAVK